MIQAGDGELESSAVENALGLLVGSEMSVSQQNPGSREGDLPPGLQRQNKYQ